MSAAGTHETTEQEVLAYMSRRCAQLAGIIGQQAAITITAYSGGQHLLEPLYCYAHAAGKIGNGATLTSAIHHVLAHLNPPAKNAALAAEKRAQAHRLIHEAEQLETGSQKP